MGFNRFRKFTKWLAMAALSTQFILPNFALAETSQTPQRKTASLEETFIRKDIATNKFAEGTPLEKKSEREIELKVNYNPNEKEVTIGIYTPNWDETIEKYKGTDISEDYLNIRSDSKFYLILPRDNTEFVDIDEKGYFQKFEKQKVFGEWDRLIPEGKNPAGRVKDRIKSKALSEVLKANARTTIKDFFGYWEATEELSMDDLAEKLGKEYEVREIEMYTPEGFKATVNSATEIIIQLNTSPEKTQKWMLVYNLSLGNNALPLGVYYCKGQFPFKIQGSLERKLAEEQLIGDILETAKSDKERFEEFLNKLKPEFLKYFPQKNELPSDYFLTNAVYTLGTGVDEEKDFFENGNGEKTSFKEITGNVVESIVLTYSDIKKERYDFDFKIMRCKKDAYKRFGEGLEFLFGFCYFDERGFLMEVESISKFDFEQDLIGKQKERLGIIE